MIVCFLSKLLVVYSLCQRRDTLGGKVDTSSLVTWCLSLLLWFTNSWTFYDNGILICISAQERNAINLKVSYELLPKNMNQGI